MTSLYPDGIDVLAIDKTATSPQSDHHTQHNDLAAAVIALEQTLGIGLEHSGGPLEAFPRRRVGEKAHWGRLEVAGVATSTASPAGEKELIIAEDYGPGILRYLWLALNSDDGAVAGSDPLEDSGRIRIYFDDELIPKIDEPINFFFGVPLGGSGGKPTPYFGRTLRSNYSSVFSTGQFRYMHAPYRRYMRVCYLDTDDVTVAPTEWCQAGFSRLTAELPVTDERRSYRIFTNEDAAHPALTKFEICDITGRGQIEGVWVEVRADDAGDGEWIEGNLEIRVDGETYPAVISTGNEDWPNGAFGTIVEGGFPAGFMGAGGASNGSVFYRYFAFDPIFFETALKVEVNIGQRGQHSSIGGALFVRGALSAWLDQYETPINFWTPDTATPTLTEDFTGYAAADLPSPWEHPASGDRWQGGGNVATSPAATETDRFARRDVGITDYVLEADVRITGADANAEAFLAARSSAVGLGNCVSIELQRVSQYDWRVKLRDSFDQPAVVKIDRGLDLLDQPISLRLRVRGAEVRGWWRFPGEALWQPVGQWQTAKLAATGIALGQWAAAAAIDNLRVYPLQLQSS